MERYLHRSNRTIDQEQLAICRQRGHVAGKYGMSAGDGRQPWLDCKHCGMEFRMYQPEPELQERECSQITAHNIVVH